MKHLIDLGTYQANQDTQIKYVFALGGGIHGRTVKKGERVTVISTSTEIDTPCVSTAETLYKIAIDGFKRVFDKVVVGVWRCSECGNVATHEEMEATLGRKVADIDLIVCECDNVMKPKYNDQL